ncbi:VOC family protein [Curvibacter sp. CHRR-16]|uniref:VOC family protein n=1 Tax=Curvibacter sp. CHRR-16 TaxID=2835872 RepID=UPI001BD9FA60|nr:VOC family protein [Curvibacter sp. CHRR-16]
MSRSFLDHITITTFSLEAGAAFVFETLGVSPQVGGEHPRMATHNLLLRLGDTTFLEVIAPNPSVSVPSRPRWFALDSLGPQSPPSLSTWVVRTSDIHAAAVASSEPLGNVEPMSRGALNWLITIPADGSVPLDGAGPALIEWHTDLHPAAKLEDMGLSLAKFEIVHPNPDRVSRLLSSLELDAPVSVLSAPSGTSARLVAHINTPQGLRVL